MKKIGILLVALVLFVACNDTSKENNKEVITTKNSNLAVYKGEFIYTADAAVLKGNDFIYGVTIDEKMHELADRVAPVKKDDFDMVPVVVTGTLKKKDPNAEGWDEVLTIVDIVQVSNSPAKADVTINDNKEVEKVEKQ